MPDKDKLPRVYVDSPGFIEIVKHDVLATHDVSRDYDVWILKRVLLAHRHKRIQVLTSMLTVAECQHAESLVTDRVKKLLKVLLTSGQYVHLIQPTILEAERARDLRWDHGLTLGGPDGLHVGSALQFGCIEFLTFDGGIIKHDAAIKKLGLAVRYPRDSAVLPPQYRQEEFTDMLEKENFGA